MNASPVSAQAAAFHGDGGKPHLAGELYHGLFDGPEAAERGRPKTPTNTKEKERSQSRPGDDSSGWEKATTPTGGGWKPYDGNPRQNGDTGLFRRRNSDGTTTLYGKGQDDASPDAGTTTGGTGTATTRAAGSREESGSTRSTRAPSSPPEPGGFGGEEPDAGSAPGQGDTIPGIGGVEIFGPRAVKKAWEEHQKTKQSSR